MTVAKWTCRIPDFDLLSPNRLYRMHFAQRSRYKKSIEAMLIAYGDNIMPIQSPCKVKIVRQYGYRKREMDEDNLYGACKSLIDALKVRKKNKDGGLGIIEDDSPKHIELSVSQEKSSDKKTYIDIFVESE